MAIRTIEYELITLSAAKMIQLQRLEQKDYLAGYPLYWSPEVWNNPYTFPEIEPFWPVPHDGIEVIILGDERPDEPWNQRAIWRFR